MRYDESEFGRIYDKKGKLLYAGMMKDGRPFGEGVVYYPDGRMYQEGTFDFKGLIEGRVYYANGQLFFEGTYEVNKNYGPNRPVRGDYYSRAGKLLFSGAFKVRSGGVGFPIPVDPPGFPIKLPEAPEIKYAMNDSEK